MEKVVALDSASQTLAILETKTDLAKFGKLWSTKAVVKEISDRPYSEFPFSIRIESKRGELWKYNSSGFAMILTKGPAKLYRVNAASDLNALLRIPEPQK